MNKQSQNQIRKSVLALESTPKEREHAEFHNAYTFESVRNDITFLNVVYEGNTGLSVDDVNTELINSLKVFGKEIYYFILSLGKEITPQIYIKRKYEFIKNTFPDGNKHLFYLAWNGLIRNDSFRRLLLQRFSLTPFFDVLSPNNIPYSSSSSSRYRTKAVLADDMATNPDGSMRTEGRALEDGSGLKMLEKIIWFPNGKAMPMFPQGYVPSNQTHAILIRHGKSEHESGGENPKFVGSGYWDTWKDNKRISGSIGNTLHANGVLAAQDLGKDFKVAVDILSEAGCPLWSWADDAPVIVFGSESINTEQTAANFLKEAGYSNITFNAVYGLNSQKYGALTHKYKNEVMQLVAENSGNFYGADEKTKMLNIKNEFKNRFYHYPEGETLIEADWRIAYTFIELLRNNLGKRILIADHSGAIRVFEAIIKTLDFAEYASIKEAQDSIMAFCFQPGKNMRYDYLQKKSFLLRKKE